MHFIYILNFVSCFFLFQVFEECQKVLIHRGNLYLKRVSGSRTKIAKIANPFITDGSVSFGCPLFDLLLWMYIIQKLAADKSNSSYY